MSGLKTLMVGIFVFAAGQGAGSGFVDLPREFSTCAGRYSAMMEHAWLMQSPDADEYQRLRRAFLSLLDAATDDAGATRLHLRIDAKAAHAQLLQVASFSPDPSLAERARRQSEAHLALCRQLVLGG